MAVTTEVFYRIGELIGVNGYLGKVGSINTRVYEPSASLTTSAIEALERLAEIGVPEAVELLSHIPGLVLLLGM